MVEVVTEKVEKKKATRLVPTSARAYVAAGFNNTIIAITDADGRVLASGSAGLAGFKGTRKATPFAASVAAERAGQKALNLGVREVAVFVKGPGSGRLSSVKALRAAGLRVTSITDQTPMPHNGCRPKKRRRV